MTAGGKREYLPIMSDEPGERGRGALFSGQFTGLLTARTPEQIAAEKVTRAKLPVSVVDARPRRKIFKEFPPLNPEEFQAMQAKKGRAEKEISEPRVSVYERTRQLRRAALVVFIADFVEGKAWPTRQQMADHLGLSDAAQVNQTFTVNELREIEYEALAIRRGRFASEISKVYVALLEDAAMPGSDAATRKLVFQRFEGWSEKVRHSVEELETLINIEIQRITGGRTAENVDGVTEDAVLIGHDGD